MRFSLWGDLGSIEFQEMKKKIASGWIWVLKKIIQDFLVNKILIVSTPFFVRRVFEIASEYTDAILEIRDFNIAFGGKKADGLYQLVKHLKNSGVKIDAVGFQCHLNVGTNYNYENLEKNINRFIKLGVEVYITELDVGLNLWGLEKQHY